MKTLFYFSILIFSLALTSARPVTIKIQKEKNTVLTAPVGKSKTVTVNVGYIPPFIPIPQPAPFASIKNETTGQAATTNALGNATLDVSIGDTISGLFVKDTDSFTGSKVVASDEFGAGVVNLALHYHH
jgi:hypothetical protein